MNPETKAREMVEAIYCDIRNRKFLKWLWSDEHVIATGVYSLDSAVQEEIAAAWTEIIANALLSERTACDEQVVEARRDAFRFCEAEALRYAGHYKWGEETRHRFEMLASRFKRRTLQTDDTGTTQEADRG